MLTLTVRSHTNTLEPEYWSMCVTPAWAEKHDNGVLISIGLTVGRDGFTPKMWKAAQRRFHPKRMSLDAYQHSGCQSSCIRRGQTICRW